MPYFTGTVCNDNRETVVVMQQLRDEFRGDGGFVGPKYTPSSHVLGRSGMDLRRNMPLIIGVAVAIYLPGY